MAQALIAFSKNRLLEQEIEILVEFTLKRLSEQVPRIEDSYPTEIDRIKNALEAMRLYLRDAERQSNDEAVKNWVEDLTRKVYDLAVKSGALNVYRRSNDHWQSSSIFKGLLACLFRQHHPQQGDFSASLRVIACQLEDIKNGRPERMLQYNSDQHHELPSLPHRHEIKVQKDYADKLEEFILQEQADRVTILVYGEAGTGKSTIVSMACDRVKRHFIHFAWVTVTDLRDIKDIRLRILINFCKHSISGVDEKDEVILRDNISNFLNGNKYLLVLDGMEDNSLLQEVISHLPNSCGKIVITTACAHLQNTDFHHTLTISPLSPEDAHEFFCRKVSRSRSAASFESDIRSLPIEDIVMKCERSLLGIAIVGSLLSTKTELCREWNEVIVQFQHPRPIKDTFALIGYRDLHPILKACFLYTSSLFSENFEIPKRKLIRMWMGEGFAVRQKEANISAVGTSSNETAEEIAENQLNQLLQRNMLEISQLADNGEVEAIRVLPPMRKLALLEDPSPLQGLVQQNSSKNIATTITKSNCGIRSRQQSVLLWEVNKVANLSKGKFKLLQVLDLRGMKSIISIDHLLVNLLLLQYLGLRGTGIENLPLALGKLQNLQTLDIRNTRVRSLPEKCEPLAELRHLFLAKSRSDQVVRIPSSFMSNSMVLQTLTGMEVPSAGAQQVLQHLTQLKKLSAGNVMERDSERLCTSINHMTQLRSLTLKCNGREQIQIQSLEQNLSLVKLGLGGRINQLLEKVSRLSSLVSLFLWDCNLAEDPLSALCHLPSLVRFSLNNAYAGKHIHRITRGFSKLKYLTILRFKNVEVWEEIESGAMDMLQKLYIGHCPNLKMPPKGLETLCGGLVAVTVVDMPESFQDSVRNQGYTVHFLNRRRSFCW